MSSTAKKYSNEMEKRIVEEYLMGASTKFLMNKYGFKTRKSITDKVKKYGHKVRSNREEIMKDKPYEYFSMDIINSEFKAYFLGLLLTDGYIVRNTVGLDLTDEDCIQFISSIIEKPYHSYERDQNRLARHRIIINNQRLVCELERFGVVPRKTKTLHGFTLQEDEQKYFPYIIRGMIDGDGWIRKDGKEFYICTASYDMALWVKKTLENKLYMSNLNIEEATGVWQVRTANSHNIDILKTLVYDKPFGMSRKYNKLHSEPSETIMEYLTC
jgi:hypothetical protein